MTGAAATQKLNKKSTRSGNKSAGAFRTISEVASELNVPQYVLRFWETRFTQIKPMKRGGGRRYYRPEDVALLKQIRSLLYDDCYTIKGVQKLFRDGELKKAREQSKSASKEQIVISKAVEIPAANRSGLGTERRAKLQDLLRELVSLRKLLDEA